MSKKIELLKELHFLVRALNKIDKSPEEEIFRVCKNFIENLTDYFFIILDLGTTSFEYGYFYTELNGNDPLINFWFNVY